MQVQFSLTCRTRYATIVEMDEQKYARLRDALDNGNRKQIADAEEELRGLISPSQDWQDDEVTDVDDFEPYTEDAPSA